MKGYGTYSQLIQEPVNVIIDMIHYNNFTDRYENIFYKKLEEKNKNGSNR